MRLSISNFHCKPWATCLCFTHFFFKFPYEVFSICSLGATFTVQVGLRYLQRIHFQTLCGFQKSNNPVHDSWPYKLSEEDQSWAPVASVALSEAYRGRAHQPYMCVRMAVSKVMFPIRHSEAWTFFPSYARSCPPRVISGVTNVPKRASSKACRSVLQKGALLGFCFNIKKSKIWSRSLFFVCMRGKLTSSSVSAAQERRVLYLLGWKEAAVATGSDGSVLSSPFPDLISQTLYLNG